MKRPNVLLLYTDQQRWDTIGSAGLSACQTPNLDRLAARGALMQNAFCNSPVCMPSRHSMLSGLYPSTIGTTCNGIEMPEDAQTLTHILGTYGYRTANIGKLHFRNHAHRDHRELHPSYGFDELILSDEPGCYDDAYIKWVEARDPSQVANCRCATPPAWTGPPVAAPPRNTHEPYPFAGPEEMTHSAFVAEESADYIRRRKGELFFLISGFYAPHAPVNPPQRFVEMYDPTSLPAPHMNEGENSYGLSMDEWQVVKAYYYALVTHIDDQVGRIFDALDETGQTENTLVIFTSDHGEHLGDHGRVQKGPPGFDSCAHVPMILSLPGKVQAGLRPDQLIESIDVAATILDFCAIQTPPAMQGKSMSPLLMGQPYEERSSAFIEYRQPFGPSWKTVRTHLFKYAISNQGDELLFDLVRDPHELVNCAEQAAYAETKHEMAHLLNRRWFDVESQNLLRAGQY